MTNPFHPPTPPTHTHTFTHSLTKTDDADIESATASALSSLNVAELTTEEKRLYDDAAVKLQKITRGIGGKRKAILKSEMKIAATEIGDSVEVQVAAARLQAQYRARKDRLYVENLKKEKQLLQQGMYTSVSSVWTELQCVSLSLLQYCIL